MSADARTDPSLTVAAVARRLGVAPATLRTWDRRYGLGPSEHLAGAHRRYSAADVARLLTMRRLTLEGVAPSEAARTAREGPGGATGPSTVEVLDAYTDAVVMAPDPAALAGAAGAFDNAAVRWMLARVHPRDVLDWWTDLVEPALATLAARPVLERPGESAVRGLEAAAFAELRSRVAAAGVRTRVAPPSEQLGTVLAVPAGPGPDLVAHVLATALQEHAVTALVLTGGGPAAVLGAVEALAPAAVLLHVAAELPGDLLAALGERAPDLPLFVHRAGSAPLEVAPSLALHRVRTLTGALHEILAVVR
ncbi:MerR family transcriptional regulator [Actinotalea sp.]|uniref:MerR family transcriptional regulator n=1 Tax=Actinotalea sp. TaxID=1872145 RepID=UPI002C5F13E6|nr:MerR family transcriptional regulator [Actinotalea sp.]HQY34615.1 MerR family transcriptional regulator [Actinotalea sp.]HRA51565.1 MerR family transcriptional regulator [Actinotalea sp.]